LAPAETRNAFGRPAGASLGINADPREVALGIFDLVYRKSFPVLYEAGQSGNFIQLGEFFGQAFSVH